MTPNDYPISKTSLVAQTICVILFTFAIQGTQTVSLHCVELQVNMSRDENTCQQARLTKCGASISSDAFDSAATSSENFTLFISQALLHWLLGQCLSVHFLRRFKHQGMFCQYDLHENICLQNRCNSTCLFCKITCISVT